MRLDRRTKCFSDLPIVNVADMRELTEELLKNSCSKCIKGSLIQQYKVIVRAVTPDSTVEKQYYRLSTGHEV
ncbi:hypothetical protein Tco_0370430 [Tanacetum coccineum]